MRIPVEGGKCLYVEHHRGAEEMPVVLVHGGGMSSRSWDSVLPALLDAGHAVVLIDLRGSGRSDRDFDDYSVGALGGDVIRVADHLGLQRMILCGWSLGGAVVVDAAARLGSRVAALAITGGATPRVTIGDDWPHGNPAGSFEAIRRAIIDGGPDVYSDLAERLFHGPASNARLEWARWLFHGSSVRTTESFVDLDILDQRPLLGGIAAPALVLHGRHDRFVEHAIGERLAAMLPNAELASFEESGHAPFLEEPALYRVRLLEFFARLTPGRTAA